jgi:hypothetical protein
MIAVLANHRRLGGTRGMTRVDRAGVEAQVGWDCLDAVDEWVTAHGGGIVRLQTPTSRGLRAGGSVLRVDRAPQQFAQYELPAAVLAN